MKRATLRIGRPPRAPRPPHDLIDWLTSAGDAALLVAFVLIIIGG